ncbi:MAG TPA: AraC family transcriptional regulator [Clostridiaceae bacterium]
MSKKLPYSFSCWEKLKDNFRFNIAIHKINGCFESHRHSYLEFYSVIEGTGIEIINGVCHNIRPNSFTLLLPYQVHEFNSTPGVELKIYDVSMELDLLLGPNKISSSLNKMILNGEDKYPSYIEFKDLLASKVHAIFENMFEEFQLEDLIWGNLIFFSKVTELLALFDRERRKSFYTECCTNIKPKNNFWNLVYYLHNHYFEDINLKSLSDMFYLNTSYLSCLFKKNLGKNFIDFLNELRIMNACSLLSTTELPVTQIAYDVGFRSYSSFSRVFKLFKGISPSEFRK